jgi:hypothetical protein
VNLSGFRVFAFDGLHGFGQQVEVGSTPGTLAGGSVIRIVPEFNPLEDPQWITRIVSNCMSEHGVVQFPLAVDRQILARVVINTPVHGAPASIPGGSEGLMQGAVVRTDADTTVALLEPVSLNVVLNTRHTGDLFANPDSDIDASGLATCVGRQELGVETQVALPRGVRLEVLKAAPESSSWMLPEGTTGGGGGGSGIDPVKPCSECNRAQGGYRVWLPVLLGIGLLGLAGWIILNDSRRI